MTKTILAVDDSGSFREFYMAALGAAGYEVRTAVDGLQALTQIREHCPDLILLDIYLPRVSGWDVLQAVRGTPRWAGIPVIVASVLNDPDSLALSWCMGCTWYLPKPMETDDLLLLVDRLLGPDAAPSRPGDVLTPVQATLAALQPVAAAG